jgi:hypothetical protein
MSAASYAHAVLAPFDPEGFGAQVPDLYVFPSTTDHIKTNFTLYADNNGNFDMIINPSLVRSVYTSYNSCVGGSFPYNLTVPNNLLGAGSNAQISSVITDFTNIKSYRIVGVGFRMSSLLVPMTSTGTLTVATLPTARAVPGDNLILNLGTAPTTLGNTSASANQNPANQLATLLTNGNAAPGSASTSVFSIIGADGYINPVVQSLPTGKQMTHFEFNDQGLDWATRAIGPRALEWRSVVDTMQIYNGTTWAEENATAYSGSATATTGFTSSSLQTFGGNPYSGDFFANGDMCQLLIRGVGFPSVTTGNTKVANCELIFHIEYIDNKITSLSSATFPPVQKGYLDDVLDIAAKFPLYRSIKGTTQREALQRLGITQ